MPVIRVSDAAGLLSALRTSKGGETIVLADGNYGEINLRGRWSGTNINPYSSTVTITAEHEGQAKFDVLRADYASNLSFQGLALKGGFSATNSKNISFSDSTATHLSFRDTSGVTLADNHVSGGTNTLTMWSVAGFKITGNTFEKAGLDLIQISRNSYNGLIENNVLRDIVTPNAGAHPDLIQLFGQGGMNPHDITIRGNHLYDDPATGRTVAQGIFLSDPSGEGFRNILIEQNLVSVRSPNSIYVAGGQENVIIRDNTLIGGTEAFKGGSIRLVDRAGFDNSGVIVEGNLARILINEGTGARIGENTLYRTTDAAAALFGGNGAQMSDFVSDSLVGATSFLQAKGLIAPPLSLAQPPAPAPVPSEAEDLPHQVASMHNLSMSAVLKPAAAWANAVDGAALIAHDPDLAITEGTVTLDFNADTVSWRRALLSKDAVGTDHGLSAWISNGSLKVAFEDGSQIATVTKAGLKAHTDYELQITFGDGKGQVWLDGTLVGEVATGMDWAQNDETLVLGADNSRSKAGTTSSLSSAFDGTLSGFAVYDQALTPAQVEALLEARGTGLALLTAGETPEAVAAVRDLHLTGRISAPAAWKLDPVAILNHQDDMAVSEGTLAFHFDADAVGVRRGLVSKDAAGLDHGLTAWISGGSLNIAFEDDKGVSYVSQAGIRTGQDYDVQITFGEGKGRVWLDGTLIGEVATGMDWTENTEKLVVGADNSASKAGGTAALRAAFDGDLDGFVFYDHAMTPEELARVVSAQGDLLG